MERGEDSRICFCPYCLSGGSISAAGCNPDKSESLNSKYIVNAVLFLILASPFKLLLLSL